MKKQIKVLVLVIALIMACTLTVNAADATVTLNPSKQQLVPGEEFTITFSAECATEIEGIDSNLIYDKEKLDFIKADKANSNWNVMDTDLSDVTSNNYDRNIAVYCNGAKTSDDIFIMTFKVKETAPVNTTAEISLNGIVLYAANNQSYDIETKTIEVSIAQKPSDPGENDEQDPKPENPQEKTLTGIEITKAPTRTTYRAGEKFDKTGMKVTAKYSDGSSKEITNYTVENGDKLVKGQTSVKISYTEGNVTKTVEQKITLIENPTNSDNQNEDGKKDNTQTDKEMPKTGLTSIMGAIVVIGLVGTVCYIKYNKYKKI